MAIDEARPAGPGSEGWPADAAPAPKRRRSRWLLVLILLTVLGVVAPFIGFVISRQTGSSLDAGTVFTVAIRNDTAAALVVRTCGSNCLPDVPSLALPTGASVQVGARSRGAVTTYYLFDQSGHLVGCLPLRFTREVPGLTVQASRQQPCPGKPLPAP